MEIIDFNTWWEIGAIDKETSSMKRRDLFSKLKESLEERFIEIIIGLRRVGKTVLMHQLINYLELSFLIKRVSNVRGSFLSTSRKNRKAYPIPFTPFSLVEQG